MSKLHQSTSWQVLDRQPREVHLTSVLRLQARRSGWLVVQGGQVWLTRDGGGDDHVLGRGEQFWLQSGESLVIEPWQTGGSAQLGWQLGSEARVQRPALRREAAGAGVAAVAWRGLAVVLRGAAGRLLAAARSAEAMASRPQGSIRAGDSIASCGAVQ